MNNELEQRLWSKVDASGRVDSCWAWTGGHGQDGYSRVTVKGRVALAHRLIYELLVGPIPTDHELDHLCRNPGCVNPAHLEIVTHRENCLRGESFSAKNAVKTHCPKGHAYDVFNTYLTPAGGRQCRVCNLEAVHRYRARRAS